MTFVEGTIVIQRPVEEVFDFVADERHGPQFNPAMRSVEKVTDGPIGAGTLYRADAGSEEDGEVTIEFTGFERPKRIEQSAHMDSMDLSGYLSFREVPWGTEMSWSWVVEPKGGGIKRRSSLVAFRGRRHERRTWESLRQLLEEHREEW